MSVQITPRPSTASKRLGRLSSATRRISLVALLGLLGLLLSACAQTPTAHTPAHVYSSYQQPDAVSAPTAPPTQITPLPAPANLTPAEALDWRMVQWDKATGTGTNPVIGEVNTDSSNVDVMAYIRTWVSMPMTQINAMIPRFSGRMWAADGVVKDVTSELYPGVYNGSVSVALIGIGNYLSAPGDKIRYVAVGIQPALSRESVSRMLKLEWYIASDGVGRFIVSVCPPDNDRC